MVHSSREVEDYLEIGLLTSYGQGNRHQQGKMRSSRAGKGREPWGKADRIQRKGLQESATLDRDSSIRWRDRQDTWSSSK